MKVTIDDNRFHAWKVIDPLPELVQIKFANEISSDSEYFRLDVRHGISMQTLCCTDGVVRSHSRPLRVVDAMKLRRIVNEGLKVTPFFVWLIQILVDLRQLSVDSCEAVANKEMPRKFLIQRCNDAQSCLKYNTSFLPFKFFLIEFGQGDDVGHTDLLTTPPRESL